MERFSVTDINYVHLHFKKSKELAPNGYKFLTNVGKYDYERYNLYENNDLYLIMPDAYNVYGDLLKDMVSIYKKISL